MSEKPAADCTVSKRKQQVSDFTLVLKHLHKICQLLSLSSLMFTDLKYLTLHVLLSLIIYNSDFEFQILRQSVWLAIKRWNINLSVESKLSCFWEMSSPNVLNDSLMNTFTNNDIDESQLEINEAACSYTLDLRINTCSTTL